MKRISLFLLLILILSFLSISCKNNNKNSSNVSKEPDTNYEAIDPIQEAKELMKDWQASLPISTSQAETYISQKGLLMNNKDYREKLGFDFSIPESEEETMVLDEFHEYLSYWMLMRDNMRVLYTEVYKDDYYSLVITDGYDFDSGIYLIHYTVNNEEIQILKAFSAPQIFSLQNVYMGVVNHDIPFCFGFAKKLKFDSKEEKWINSDINHIKLLTTTEEFDIQVETSKPFITFLSNETQVIGYKAMNSLDQCIEEKELTELDFSYSIEK